MESERPRSVLLYDRTGQVKGRLKGAVTENKRNIASQRQQYHTINTPTAELAKKTRIERPPTLHQESASNGIFAQASDDGGVPLKIIRLFLPCLTSSSQKSNSARCSTLYLAIARTKPGWLLQKISELS
jgi:hypothetical protein